MNLPHIIKQIYIQPKLPRIGLSPYNGKVVPVHTMKAYGVVEVSLHTFLISTLDGVEWIYSSNGRSRGTCRRCPLKRGLRWPQSWFSQFGEDKLLCSCHKSSHNSSDHLDQRLTWRTHVKAKRQQLNLKLRGMYWLLGRRSKLSLENKLLLYKCVLKPVWTYGIQLWGCAKPSHTQIIQRLE